MKLAMKLFLVLALLLPLVAGRAALVRRAADPAKAEELDKEGDNVEGKKEVLKANPSEGFYYYYGYPTYPYYGYGYPYWYYGYPYTTYPVVYV